MLKREKRQLNEFMSLLFYLFLHTVKLRLDSSRVPRMITANEWGVFFVSRVVFTHTHAGRMIQRGDASITQVRRVRCEFDLK